MPPDHILSIDQGTTSTRAIIFDGSARTVAVSQRELQQHYPQAGWVEHDPEDIWRDTIATVREAIAHSGLELGRLACIGITNQRETVVVWDRATGEPLHRAIVWQDRRTSHLCAELKSAGAEADVRARTGLMLDPYFSATKIAWILDHVPGARARAERGELAFGTIDCFLLWRLTGGATHATDVTNAARTLLYDIHADRWDPELCRLFGVPEPLLPEVHDNSHLFGVTAPGLFDRQFPIAGMAGDQQAALFGQACFEPGMVKSTYGTGAFMLLNTGRDAVSSTKGLITTPACRLDGRMTYALEGSIFVAGAAVKWLRDALGIIADASDTEHLAREVPDNRGVYLVPAFVGLGAPYWEPDVRAVITGLTLDVTRAHLARAALEAVAYQTLDLMNAMTADGCQPPTALRIDGGMAANDWLCRVLADIVDLQVERPENLETTALGVAFLAGLGTGVWSDLHALSRTWKARSQFRSSMDASERAPLVAGWRRAVRQAMAS